MAPTRDRTGDPIDEEAPTFFGPPSVCERCHGHQWIDECYDRLGLTIGEDRYDPAIADRVVSTASLPCPRCYPEGYERFRRGCWRTDGSHDHRNCTLCVEDGRGPRRVR